MLSEIITQTSANVREVHKLLVTVLIMSNSTPHIAILLCTYNGEQFLKEQLDSIIAQDTVILAFGSLMMAPKIKPSLSLKITKLTLKKFVFRLSQALKLVFREIFFLLFVTRIL